MIEDWRAIPGYEGLYEVSNQGRVRSLDRYDNIGRMRKKRYIKLLLSSSGYFSVGLSKNGNVTVYLVHRLVVQVFIPNPDGLPQVNHKDEDKTNNSVDNLEWCSAEYNSNYGTARERARSTLIKNGYCYGLSEEDNKIRLKVKRKEYYQKNKDVFSYKSKEYKETHKESIKEMNRKYYQLHKKENNRFK